jgi:hypothetical protein
MLHSNICESEKLASISYPAETLYYRLLTRVDDNGNFSADPRIVFGQCMTLREDMTPKKVAGLLEELASGAGKDKKPLIEFYETDGDRWLHFTKFEEFQYLRPDRQATVKFPEHPNQMGPKVASVVNQRYTNGKPAVATEPVVNQGYTNDTAQPVNGWPNIREEKLSKENRSEENPSPTFGSGTWRTLAIRFRNKIGKHIAATRTNKQKYSESCTEHGEDKVLSVFDQWADQNKGWVAEKNDALHFFWKELPDMMAAEDSVMEASEPEVPEAVVEQAMVSSQTERTNEVQEKLDAIRRQKEFEDAHKDEI